MAYFGHKDFEHFCLAKIIQALNRGVANYRDKVIKLLQELVWIVSDMKSLNQPLLINTNLTIDEAGEWYFEALVEVEKLNKEFNIVYPGKFVCTEWRKCDKSVDNFFSSKLNIRGIPLEYVISKDDVPMTIIFYDVAYDVGLEYCRINSAPLTGAVFKRYKVKVHKFIKSLTQGTKFFKWIDKSKGVRGYIKALREHCDGSSEVNHHMNITKEYLKYIYFKLQDVFLLKSYVNSLRESYSTLE